MAPLIWLTGASGGIGRSLVATVPWPEARVIGVSRPPAPGTEHLVADLSDPGGWDVVGDSLRRELDGFAGQAVIFVHAAGTLDPIGFAAEVDSGAYRRNVLLNSAGSQVLGQLFLAAVRHLEVPRHLVMITSGAARSVYPGWTSYGAAKAAVDQWVRNAGAEQASRGGVQVMAVAPGTVATDMQAQLRASAEDQFPARQKFIDLYDQGRLTAPDEAAGKIWRLLDAGLDNGSVVDLRDLPSA